MKELHSKMEAHGKLKAICEMCFGEENAIAFCRQCTNFICKECVKIHQRVKVYMGHVVSTLEDLKRGKMKGITFESPPPSKCEDHNEPRKFFCIDCNECICRDCVLLDHRDHKYEFVKKAISELSTTAVAEKHDLTLNGSSTEVTSLIQKNKSKDGKIADLEEALTQVQRELTSFKDQYDHEMLRMTKAYCSKKAALDNKISELRAAQLQIYRLKETNAQLKQQLKKLAVKLNILPTAPAQCAVPSSLLE